MLSGNSFEPDEIKNLLKSKLIFKDNNIKLAIDFFEVFIFSREWKIVFCDEKNYKAFVVIEKSNENIKLELNIPSEYSISKKGIISSIKIIQASSQGILENFKKDFLDE